MFDGPLIVPQWAALAVALLLLVLAVAWWRARTAVARGNRGRQRVARAGEDDAERLLGAAGFRIVERQVTGAWVLEIDGEPVEVRCRADLLVEARGRRFVAEVKTGDRAPDPTRPQTRRQLLEYHLAFEVDGVLLVDMEERRIRTVRFPDLP